MDLPSEEALRRIVSFYAHLRARHGAAIEGSELVLPTGDFFPDPFAPSPEGVATLLKRILSYAPVSDAVPLELAFAEGGGEGGCGSGGCGSGGCGTGGACGTEGCATCSTAKGPVGEAVAAGEGYRVIVAVSDVPEPALLAASLARSAGGIVLGEAGEDVAPNERGVKAELAGVACGLGLLLLNGACLYAKSCGGLRARQGTYLDVTEVSVALALFLRVHGGRPASVRAHLETTQREAFDEALRWVDSNGAIIAALGAHPESLEDGVFPIHETKGLLSRLFAAKGAAPPDISAPPVVKRRVRSEEEERRLAETKALVEEALRAR